GRGPYLSQGGDWKVTVDLRRNTGTDLAEPFSITVGGSGFAAASRGGGMFAWPRHLSASSAALLVVAACGSLALVVASWPRPGRPAGYLGSAGRRLGRFAVRPSISLTVIVVVGIGLGILLGAHRHKKLPTEVAQ